MNFSITQTPYDPLMFAIGCPIPPNFLENRMQTDILMRYPGDLTHAQGQAMEQECADLFAATACRLFEESEVGQWLREADLDYALDGRAVWSDRVLALRFNRADHAALFKLRWH